MGPIPDLSRVACEGRIVRIAYDSDAATNPEIQQARSALARYLQKRGAARVQYVLVPSREEL